MIHVIARLTFKFVNQLQQVQSIHRGGWGVNDLAHVPLESESCSLVLAA
jgi:hypothetical protein